MGHGLQQPPADQYAERPGRNWPEAEGRQRETYLTSSTFRLSYCRVAEAQLEGCLEGKPDDSR